MSPGIESTWFENLSLPSLLYTNCIITSYGRTRELMLILLPARQKLRLEEEQMVYIIQNTILQQTQGRFHAIPENLPEPCSIACSMTSIFSSKPIPKCKILIHDGMLRQNVTYFHKMWEVMEQTRTQPAVQSNLYIIWQINTAMQKAEFLRLCYTTSDIKTLIGRCNSYLRRGHGVV